VRRRTVALVVFDGVQGLDVFAVFGLGLVVWFARAGLEMVRP
jgi:hypothetical protein